LIEKEPARVYDLFRRVSRKLAPMSGLLMVGGLFCPVLFPLVFGAKWAQSGQFAGLLAVFCAAQMLVSPVSNIAVLMRRQGSQLVLDALRTTAVVLSLWLPYRAGASPLEATAWFVGSTLGLYAGYYVFYRQLARKLVGKS